MLKAHAPLMNSAATQLQHRLAAHPPGQPVQMNNMLAGLTMEVIGGAAFGYAAPLANLAVLSISAFNWYNMMELRTLVLPL